MCDVDMIKNKCFFGQWKVCWHMKKKKKKTHILRKKVKTKQHIVLI